MKGTIKWFNSWKGYGFILTDEDKDIFVHKEDIYGGTLLNEGDTVEFDIKETDRGPKAVQVKKIQ